MLIFALSIFMIKIVIPKNMSKSVIEHLEEAGRTVSFDEGKNLGTVLETQDRVVRTRSFDIPFWVAEYYDVGLCGSDCVKETELARGIKLDVLSHYSYGREHYTTPTLDMVAHKDDKIQDASEIQPGSVVITEYPHLTIEFLKNKGISTAEIGKEKGVPSYPAEFHEWCKGNGVVGIEVLHGGIAEAVHEGDGYGVMVSETGKTLTENNLKVLDNIHKIETLLIADPHALRDSTLGLEREIRSLHQDLDRAYLTIYGESEASLRSFKERR